MDIVISLLIGLVFGMLQFWLLKKLSASLVAQQSDPLHTGLIIGGKLLAWAALLLAVTLLFSPTAMLWGAGGAVFAMIACVLITSRRAARREAAAQAAAGPSAPTAVDAPQPCAPTDATDAAQAADKL